MALQLINKISQYKCDGQHQSTVVKKKLKQNKGTLSTLETPKYGIKTTLLVKRIIIHKIDVVLMFSSNYSKCS